MTEKARCFSPHLWIIDENGNMIGDIHFSGLVRPAGDFLRGK
ncbi:MULTISPECIES: hypothetical protein [Akkermansia]|jgi:hypothetical protein|nr:MULTISPECIES: hypothetical protein [Akkermansia]